ncbi:MAG: hypothetical protein JWN18_145 [Parcubacteria group bacterium]|nr:hypothetical protein [Parcubacteria group bacterium]
MKRRHTGLYHSLVLIPDRLYPFKTQVAGQWVRGIRSYNATLAQYQRTYGAGHYGFKLSFYRQVNHLIGSILFLGFSAYLSQKYLGGEHAMYAFLGAAVFLISFQEFYLHRRMYQQLWRKGVVDWLAWCVPMGIYFFTHFH